MSDSLIIFFNNGRIFTVPTKDTQITESVLITTFIKGVVKRVIIPLTSIDYVVEANKKDVEKAIEEAIGRL